MFSLESPHRGDSNEYTQYTIFNMNKKNTINYPKSAATGFFSKGLKNEFETAVVNEPSVFEPLKFYCRYSFRSKNSANFVFCLPSQWISHKRQNFLLMSKDFPWQLKVIFTFGSSPQNTPPTFDFGPL